MIRVESSLYGALNMDQSNHYSLDAGAPRHAVLQLLACVLLTYFVNVNAWAKADSRNSRFHCGR